MNQHKIMELWLETKLKKYIYDFCNQYNFSPREIEIFYLLIFKVLSHEHISKILNISVNTVNNHLKNIIAKTQVLNKTDLLLKFSYYVFEKNIPYQMLYTKKNILFITNQKNSSFTNILNQIQIKFPQYYIDYHNFDNIQSTLSYIQNTLPRFVIIEHLYPIKIANTLLNEYTKISTIKGIIFIHNDERTKDEIYQEQDIPSLMVTNNQHPTQKNWYFNNLMFFILENDLESDFDKSRLKRISFNEIVNVNNNTWDLNIKNIGLGGAFIYCDEKKLKNIKLYPNDVINIKFNIQNKPLSFEAQVVWRLDEDKIHKPSGFGIKFILNQKQHNYQELRSYVINTKISNLCSLK